MHERTNLGDLIRSDVDPDKVAVIDLLDPENPRSSTFAEVDAGANAVARGLLKRGLKPGDHVAVLAANSTDFVHSYMGIMRAGLVCVPTNWRFPDETIRFVLEDADVKLVLCDEKRRTHVPDGHDTVTFGPEFEALKDPGPFEIAEQPKDAVAQLLYTSGSTGRPKGVPLTHYGQLWAVMTNLGNKPADHHRVLVAAPLYHMNALMILKRSFLGGGTMVLMPQFDARGYIEAIGRYQVTWLTSIPTMMALLTKETDLLEKTDLSSVEILRMGSAPVSESLLARLQKIFPRATIMNGYGTTEAGPAVFGPHPDGLPQPPLSVGHPLKVIDWRLRPIGDDPKIGVLQMRSPAVMPGYHKLPQKTAERIDAEGYYETGDVFRIDENGFFFFHGRDDDMFVCNGENIYPSEVERMLETAPEVDQASVVPVVDDVRGQMPVAFIVPARGAHPDEDMIKKYALAHAPGYMHPRHVVFLEQMPLAGTSKIDRAILTRKAESLFGQDASGKARADQSAA